MLWRTAWQPTPVFLPGESHGQRSLVGHSSWGCKELEMTEATYYACCKMLYKFSICIIIISSSSSSSRGKVRIEISSCEMGTSLPDMVSSPKLVNST